MKFITHVVLALAATGAAVRYTTPADCFILEGRATNGTSFGFLNVGVWSLAPHSVFGTIVSNSSWATKLGIDARTGNLMDRDQGNADFWPTTPHKGLLASVIKSGVTSDVLWFKSPEALKNETTPPRVAINCRLNHSRRLNCAHPFVPNYNVFQYCAPPVDISDLFPTLKLGTGIDQPGLMQCVPVIVTARASQGCL